MSNFTPQQIEQFLREFFDVVGTRQYTGARYVPIFGRAGETDIYWNDSDAYEPLTIVLYQGDSYTSRRYVPRGIDIHDTDYWVITGRYNAQVEQYRQQVLAMGTQVDENMQAIEDEHDAMLAAVAGLRGVVESDYVPFPDEGQHSKYGTLGQVLSTLSTGETLWVDPVTVTPEVAGPIIQAWLNDHPEATTTVANNSVTDAKLVQSGGVLQSVAFTKDSTMFNVLQVQLDSTSSNGVSFVNNNDGTVTLTGTATDQATFILMTDRTPRYGTYSLFGVPANTEGWYVQCDGIGRDSGAGTTHELLAPSLGNAYIRISAGVSFPSGGLTFRPVITKTNLTKANFPNIAPVEMLLDVWRRTNVRVVEVNSSSYAHVLADADDATSDTVYELVFSLMDPDIPDNLPVRHIQGTNATLITIGNVNGLYATQIFIMSNAVFRRVRSGGGTYTNWRVIAGTFTEYVGATGRFFTTIKSALEAVEGLGTAANHVRVEVDAGTYDLLSEMGGDAFLARIDAGSGNRNGLRIPTYVDLVGIGNVWLNMLIPDNKSTEYTVEKISAIETFGECTLENLIINAQNCRYCIHDETGGSTDYAKMNHVYRRITAHHLANTHAGWVSQDALGFGVSRRNTYLFENCAFTSDTFTAFGLHNNAGASECDIVFDGVTFDGSYTFSQEVGPVCAFISYYGSNTLESTVVFKNVNASEKFAIKQETSQVPSDDIYVVYNYTDVTIARS